MTWWLDPEKVRKRNETMKRNIQRKYGVDNPRQIKGITEKIKQTCEERYGGVGYASEELKQKSFNKTKKRFGDSNVMKTEKGISRYKKTIKKKYGVDNPYKVEEFKLKTSIALKGRPSPLKGKTYIEILGEERAAERIEELRISGAIGCSMTPRISAPQLQLYELVKQKYPTAILEYPLGGYCIDVAVPELKLAFEYDGSYWHDEEKDKIRDKILSTLGWTVYRFVDALPNFL